MQTDSLIDISWPISPDMTAYKDRKVVVFEATKTFDKDEVREALVTLGTHSGTHVDAPAHFVKDGKTIDQISLDHFIGSCRVLDMTVCKEKISADDLRAHKPQEHEIILLKTKNSQLKVQEPFNKDFVYIDSSAAQFLAECRVKTVGIDYLGIERGQSDHASHIALFEAGIIIVEGLRLAQAQGGHYFLSCLPLLLAGLEAAPARALLLPLP